METRLTLRPGQNGTRKLVARFGKHLVRVRYRYDAEQRKRYTTVELIVVESSWTPHARVPRATCPAEDMVFARVAYGEQGLRAKLIALGAIWRPQLRLWELPWGVARGLGIDDRVVGP